MTGEDKTGTDVERAQMEGGEVGGEGVDGQISEGCAAGLAVPSILSQFV